MVSNQRIEKSYFEIKSIDMKGIVFNDNSKLVFMENATWSNEKLNSSSN